MPLPSSAERAAIEAARQRAASRNPPFAVRIKSEGRPQFGPTHADGAGWVDRLEDVFGTRSSAFAVAELNRFVNAARTAAGPIDECRVNALLAVVGGVRPANEIEAMLACQMAVTHMLAMDLLARARRAEQIPQFESAGNVAAKMLRAFTAQVEALAKLQRGNAQTVRVEHVHVHAGGQAIVGSVSHQTPTGGRGADKIENQPHAPQEPRSLTFMPAAPLRGSGDVPGTGSLHRDFGDGAVDGAEIVRRQFDASRSDVLFKDGGPPCRLAEPRLPPASDISVAGRSSQENGRAQRAVKASRSELTRQLIRRALRSSRISTARAAGRRRALVGCECAEDAVLISPGRCCPRKWPPCRSSVVRKEGAEGAALIGKRGQ